jgi:Holliday junction resolvase RusA-like endonuclease
VLTVTVPGEPGSKERARVVMRNGKARAYTPGRTMALQQQIAWYARLETGSEPDGESAFSVCLLFRCTRRRRKDVDNMVKLSLDALTGIVWKDDSQIDAIHALVDREARTPETVITVGRIGAVAKKPTAAWELPKGKSRNVTWSTRKKV